MDFQDAALLPTVVEAKGESREEAELEAEVVIDVDGDSIPNDDIARILSSSVES